MAARGSIFGRESRPHAAPRRLPEPTMRTVSRCLLLALLIAGLGVALRRALPVTPVDGALQAVLRAYAAPQQEHQQHD